MSDTSLLATGAALYQFQDNNYYIVGYHSKRMPDAAKNYSITELEFFGLAINIFAFRQLLSHVHFDCYCDHSAITYILKSKRTPPRRRIRKLIEELMQFNFSIYYLPGAKMHIADVLSRLAGRDLDPPDKVIPISFSAMQTTQQLRRSPRNRKPPMKILQPTTKVNSKQIPPSYQPQVVPKRIPEPSKKNISTSSKRNTGPKKLQPSSIPTTLAHKRILTLPPSSSPSNRKLSPSTLPTDKLTLVNPELKIPQTLPPIEIPPPQMENIDTYRSPENFLYKKPLPVLKDSKDLDIFTRHIPKQKEIDEFLQILKAKVTKDYKLPLLAKSIIAAYAQSPAFKSIYQYITTNTLPPNRRLQRSIICNADNYIVADGLLFK